MPNYRDDFADGQRPRQGRQGLGIDGQLQEGCKTTGYETQIRQDCTKVQETICNNVTVAKFNKKIEKKCTTKVTVLHH